MKEQVLGNNYDFKAIKEQRRQVHDTKKKKEAEYYRQ